ncbi:hypothetical protein [Lysinibacillus pakistanensis]|uniref:hypothetical protein n=1 Tax=Lysinibacillus pakistanensis TaxID=759811 RepID=UPI0006D1A575
MKIKPPADVTDFQRNELCGHNSKSGRNYDKAKLIERNGWKRIYIDLPGMGKTPDYEKINNSDEMLEDIGDYL